MRLTHKRLALLGAHVARGIGRLADITPARLDVLTLLLHGPLCQRDIAAKLCCCEAVVSRMVHAMMADGLVQREIPIADRRFRIVSITKPGRAKYASLTGPEWLMPRNARYDASALGEASWNADWALPLERMGLAFLAQLAAPDDAPHEAEEPPYLGLRQRHRNGVYRDASDPGYGGLPRDWPWLVEVLAPPVDEGLEPDPVSVELNAEWERNHPPPQDRPF